MSDIISLRASALPMAFRCPASVRHGEVVLNESHEAADNGTAAHAILRSLPRSQIDWGSISTIAQSYNADPEETRILVAMGAKLWNNVRGSFEGAMTEVELRYEVVPGFWLTGHADLLAVSQTSLRVGDWKTGRKDSDHSHQFRGYAVMSLLATEGIEEVTSTGLWVREQEVENYTMRREDALAWVQSLLDHVVNWDGVYRPGRHCLHCPRSHECEAANALIRRDVAAIADKSLVARAECELSQMGPDEIVSILHKADVVEKYAKRVRDAVRHYVEENGDVVGNGVRLSVVEEPRREIDPQKAWPILEQLGFKDEEFSRVMRLSISEIEEVIRERSPRGEKTAAVENLGKLLVAAGAVTTNTITKLKERRA